MTPRRTDALLSANDMAERSARMATSTGDSAFLFPPGFGLPGEEIPQALAHRVGGLRGPFAEALAGAHAELAGCDLVLDELRRLRRAVEIGEQHALDVEGQVDADEVGLLHRPEHGHPRAEAALDHF